MAIDHDQRRMTAIVDAVAEAVCVGASIPYHIEGPRETQPYAVGYADSLSELVALLRTIPHPKTDEERRAEFANPIGPVMVSRSIEARLIAADRLPWRLIAQVIARWIVADPLAVAAAAVEAGFGEDCDG